MSGREQSPEDERSINEGLPQHLDALNDDLLLLEKSIAALSVSLRRVRSQVLDLQGKAHRAEFGVIRFGGSEPADDPLGPLWG